MPQNVIDMRGVCIFAFSGSQSAQNHIGKLVVKFLKLIQIYTFILLKQSQYPSNKATKRKNKGTFPSQTFKVLDFFLNCRSLVPKSHKNNCFKQIKDLF